MLWGWGPNIMRWHDHTPCGRPGRSVHNVMPRVKSWHACMLVLLLLSIPPGKADHTAKQGSSQLTAAAPAVVSNAHFFCTATSIFTF